MSDSPDWIDNSSLFHGADKHAGAVNFVAQMAAVQQRRDLIEKQRQHTQALALQTKLIEQQNRIEQNRAELEEQRLEIEKKRAEAEASERKQRQLQAEQIKQVRLLMADCLESIGRLKKIKPTP